MATTVIRGFGHAPGRHCGSTSMSDVLRHKGVALSEPMCFGLGAGLGFYFMRDSRTPTRVIMGRSYLLEQGLCDAIGFALEEHREADPARAWERVRSRVDAGEPVILSTDLRHLPYWGSNVPFNGHRVVLAGYDEARRIALLADTDKPGLKEVPLDRLTQARASEGPPVGYTENAWFEVRILGAIRSRREAVEDALEIQAARMLRDPSGFGGCDAIDELAHEMPDWPRTLPDLTTVAIETYRSIEKRGTGGALFRRLYAEFLAECEREGLVDRARGLAARAADIAEAWTRAAIALRAVSAGEDRLAEACREMAQLAADERRLAAELDRPEGSHRCG